MGVFLDFYFWDLNGNEVFEDTTGFGHLLVEQGYYTATHVQYAFGIYVIGEDLLMQKTTSHLPESTAFYNASSLPHCMEHGMLQNHNNSKSSRN